MIRALAALVAFVVVGQLVHWLTIYAHEWAHAAVARALGYRVHVRVYGVDVLGVHLPICTGGYCQISPSIAANELTRLEDVAISLAPLLVAIATLPVGLLVAELLELPTILAAPLWLLSLGPSEPDWSTAFWSVVARDRPPLNPAIGPTAPHVVAEGIAAE